MSVVSSGLGPAPITPDDPCHGSSGVIGGQTSRCSACSAGNRLSSRGRRDALWRPQSRFLATFSTANSAASKTAAASCRRSQGGVPLRNSWNNRCAMNAEAGAGCRNSHIGCNDLCHTGLKISSFAGIPDLRGVANEQPGSRQAGRRHQVFADPLHQGLDRPRPYPTRSPRGARPHVPTPRILPWILNCPVRSPTSWPSSARSSRPR